MSRHVKGMLIAEIESRLGETRDMLVLDVSKMDAITANRFRTGMVEKDIKALTVKNSLARKALNNLGVTSLDDTLAGSSTLVWGGEDVVALSKEMAKWVKEIDELEFRGGTVEGETLDPAGVIALSKSPSREELIGQIVGLVLSPGAQLAGAMLGPGGRVSGQLKAIADKDE